MRLHLLTLTAFGPFAGTEVVDFDALAEPGLFLLHGPTGAGKTSVLDAVCFALYGVVPGARQQAARLRSDHADPGTPTRVTLEATLRGRRLRLQRSPGWDRPKRRGSGSTREQPRVVVEELAYPGAPGTVLSTRVDEAAQLVRNLMGMSAEQFCQVVLLPQGHFAEFLRAGAEARRPLLEQLFGTARFSAAESWLAEQRRGSYRELEQARTSVAHVVARVVEAAGLPAAPEDVDDEIALAWSEQLLADATRRADAARRAERQAAAVLEDARHAAQVATALDERQRRYSSAAARAAQLAAEQGRLTELAAELDSARRAAAVVPVLDALEAETVRCTVAEAEERRARASLGAAHRALPAAELLVAAGAWRGEAAVLAELAADADAERHLAVRAAELADEAGQAGAAADVVLSALQATPQHRANLESQLLTARRAADDEARAAREVELLESRLAAARRRDTLDGEQALLLERLRDATDAAQHAREHWLDVRERRLDGMAAELAAELAQGGCCPVCGAADHPCPAAPAQGAVTLLEEQEAEAQAADADGERGCRAEELAQVQVDLAAARAQAGAEPVPILAAALAAAVQELAAARECAARVPGLEHERAKLDRKVEAWREELSGHRQRRDRAEAAAAAALDQRKELVAKLRSAVGDDVSLPARRTRLSGLAAAAHAAAEAAAETARARSALTRAAARAAERVTTAGFVDPADAAAAVRPAPRVEELEHELLAAAAAGEAVTQTLTDPALRCAATAPPADVPAAQSRVQDAQQALTDAVGTARHAVDGVQRLERLTVDLAAKLDAVRPVRVHHDLVAGLSALAEGTSSDNALRMRLSAYVLAARLEQVAAAASERLHRMSAGRYTLLHSDEQAGGRVRSGLGLRVVDAWTGVQREPVTLSGGETFFASLALALGLADVVTAEVGGAPIDTLFVDEGFGSLDDDTLEEVMDVLDGLRAGGRAVGLVSHVGDLRSRIWTQLEVHKGRCGSTITQVGSAGGDSRAGAA